MHASLASSERLAWLVVPCLLVPFFEKKLHDCMLNHIFYPGRYFIGTRNYASNIYYIYAFHYKKGDKQKSNVVSFE